MVFLVSQRAVKAADSAVINIGCVSALSLPQLPDIYRQFKSREPNIMINMIDVPHFDYKSMITSQVLDVVFTPKELVSRVPELKYIPIKKRPPLLHCPL